MEIGEGEDLTSNERIIKKLVRLFRKLYIIKLPQPPKTLEGVEDNRPLLQWINTEAVFGSTRDKAQGPTLRVSRHSEG